MIKKNIRYFCVSLAVIFMSVSTGCSTDKPVQTETVREINPPSPPAPPAVVIYKVIPEKFIRDIYGYIGIRYYTYEQEKEKIKIRLDKKNSGKEDYDKAYKRIPEFGNVTLHIGRKDLMHANTKWYNFSVKKGDICLIKLRGREGIPNIKGEDGNWWNIVKLPLTEEIPEELSVEIEDTKTGGIYKFRLIKEIIR